MNMQVHIYLSNSNQIQVILEGPAHGAVTFRDLDIFTRFIEGCQDFINKQNQGDEASSEIPEAFLDAFDNPDVS